MASPVATTSRAVLGAHRGALRRHLSISAPLANHDLWSASSAAPAAPAPAPVAPSSPAVPLVAPLSSPAATAVTTSTPTPQATTEEDAASVEMERRRLARTMMAQLSGMGSTQTRANSFRPHQMRLNPVTAQQLTLNHLVASGAQMGHSLSSLKKANQPYIYGTRHGVTVFDLERATLPALRRAANVVREVAERDGVILFVGTRPGQQPSVLQACKRLGANGYHVTAERWMPGVITNASKLLSAAILSSMKHADEVTASLGSSKLATQHYQPDVVVVLNPIENAYAIREATQANIPTIAITDSDVDPRSVTYAIPANDDSLRTVELVVGVLSKAGEEGIRSRAKKLDEAEKIARKVARRNANQNVAEQSARFDPRSRRAGSLSQLIRKQREEQEGEA
ncbi:hypothetical protein ACQY0O_004880 [Thecaphora frezii]